MPSTFRYKQNGYNPRKNHSQTRSGALCAPAKLGFIGEILVHKYKPPLCKGRCHEVTEGLLDKVKYNPPPPTAEPPLHKGALVSADNMHDKSKFEYEK